jgi:hypothetical protein
MEGYPYDLVGSSSQLIGLKIAGDGFVKNPHYLLCREG